MKEKLRSKCKASSMFISVMLFLTSPAVVYSQMVTPNLRINDADVTNIVAGSKSLAVVENNVYVVWADDRVEAGNIYFSKSEDGGETFSTDIMLSGPNQQNLNMWPAIVADESGGVYVTWTGFTTPYMEGEDVGVNVWFTKSTNEGSSFDTPIQVTDNDFSVFPSIGVYDNYVYLFYGHADNLPYADYFLVRSTDGGENFHDPIQVNDGENIEEVAFDNFTSLDIDPLTGDVYLAWIDGRRENSNGDIYLAKSTDNGASIGDNVLVNDTGTDWANYEKMNPVVTVGEENIVYVGYVVENDYTSVIIAISVDDGNSFIMEEFLADNDSYCYHYDIMALSDGSAGALMITDYNGYGWNVWFAEPEGTVLIVNDTHANFLEPSLFLTTDGYFHAVWLDDREGQRNLYYARTKEFEALDVPYFENFDDVSTSFMPPGWIRDGEGGYFVAVIDWGAAEPFSQPNHLQINVDDQSSTAVAILPEFNAEIKELALMFMATMNHFGYGQNIIEVGVVTDVEDINTFELVDFIELPDDEGYNNYIVFFNDYEGVQGRIAFRFTGSEILETGGDVYVDDVHVLRSICFEPFAVPIYEDFDDLTPPELPECWIANTTNGGEVYTTNNPHYSLPNSVILLKGPGDEPYFISPPLDADIWDLKISFAAFADFVSSGSPTLEIGTMSDPYDTKTFNPYMNVTVPDDSYQEFEIKFDDYDNDDEHIVFRLSDAIVSQDVDISIDNIYIDYYIFTLTLIPEPEYGGELTGEGDYEVGAPITLQASPAEDYKFISWKKEGTLLSSDNPFDYTMPAENVTIHGHFVLETTDTYEVTIDINNPDWGYATGAGTYLEGDQVIVEAFHNPGYVFDNWTDDNSLNVTDNPYEFTMGVEDVHLTANFREAINATIFPYNFEYEDFEDVPEEIFTTITWNDANEVTRVYILIEEMEMNLSFEVTEIDENTAELKIIIPNEKSNSFKGDPFIVDGYVIFDIGDPAPYTITITDPKWWVEIFLYDEDSGDNITDAEIYVRETEQTFYTGVDGWADFKLPEGEYKIDISAEGYFDIKEYTINVIPDFEGNEFHIAMTIDDTPVTYTVTFIVEDEGDAEIAGAEIAVAGETITTDSNGEATIELEDGVYDYTVTATGYFDETGSITVDGADITETVVMKIDDTFIETPEDIKLAVFPNPARDKLTIESSHSIKQVRLLDINGQIIKNMSTEATSIELKVNNLQPGLYFIQIQTTDKVYTEQVQIIR